MSWINRKIEFYGCTNSVVDTVHMYDSTTGLGLGVISVGLGTYGKILPTTPPWPTAHRGAAHDSTSAHGSSSSTAWGASTTVEGSTHGKVWLRVAYHGSTGTPWSVKKIVIGQLARPYDDATTSSYQVSMYVCK